MLSFFGINKKTPENTETPKTLQYIIDFNVLTSTSDILTQATQIISSFYYFCLITNKDNPKKLESQTNAINYWTAIKQNIDKCKANEIVTRFKTIDITHAELASLENSNKLNISDIRKTDKIQLITLLQSNTTGIFTNAEDGKIKDTDGCTTGLMGGRKSIQTRRKKVKRNKRIYRRKTHRKNL